MAGYGWKPRKSSKRGADGVQETCRRQARSALDHVSQTLRAVGNLLLHRPLLLPTR
jgi:hypothetical protein